MLAEVWSQYREAKANRTPAYLEAEKRGAVGHAVSRHGGRAFKTSAPSADEVARASRLAKAFEPVAQAAAAEDQVATRGSLVDLLSLLNIIVGTSTATQSPKVTLCRIRPLGFSLPKLESEVGPAPNLRFKPEL